MNTRKQMPAGRPSRGCLFALLGLLALAAAALVRLVRLICRWPWPRGFPRHQPVDQPSKNPCMRIPSHVYRQPDPLIYSQKYLLAQGLAVTWDNPDIQLWANGAPVPSHALKPGTTYQVVANVWNGAVDAPAAGLPVRFSYLQFGVGPPRVPIGETVIDLPAKGAAGLPVQAIIPWTTPTQPGHYCLQVELIWQDDANPLNNLGQENIDVKPLNSPHARFEFPLHNDTPQPVTLRLAADFYQLPGRLPCERREAAETNDLDDKEVAGQLRQAEARHGRMLFPVPQAWQVLIEPGEVTLQPGETAGAAVDVTAPDQFHGRQGININALDGDALFGGVTLYVEGGN